MKYLYSFFLCIIFAAAAYANNESNTTLNPKVDVSYTSDYGTTNIVEVSVMDGNTFVVFTYHTAPYSGSWIALSSKTYLVAGGQFHTIQAWGVEADDISSLEFDKQLEVEPNTTYKFVMAFPQIPVGVENISVIEPNGFYWKGIHIKNNQPLSVNSKQYSGIGSELVGTTFRVTNSTTNGENQDQLSLTQDHAIHFYVNNDGEFSFSNHWRAQDSQSFGPIYSIKVNRIPESATSYAATEYKFTWNYNNSFDDKHGSAVVTFNVIHMDDIKKFTCKVVVMETNMILEYKGYLE